MFELVDATAEVLADLEPDEDFFAAAAAGVGSLTARVCTTGVDRLAVDDVVLAEELLAAAPGPDTMAALTQLGERALSGLATVIVAEAWEKQAAWVDARRHSAVGGVLDAYRPTPDTAGERPPDAWDDATGETGVDLGDPVPASARREVRAALRLSEGVAYVRTAHAHALATRLTATATALDLGTITGAQAAALIDAVSDRTDQVARQVEEQVSPHAARDTVANFRRRLRRALLRIDPVTEDAEHTVAKAQRRVTFSGERDGMATLVATLPALDALIVWNALTACARRDRDSARAAWHTAEREALIDAVGPDGAPLLADTRWDDPLSAWRADTLVAWAQAALAAGDAPRPQRRPVEVHVVMDLATALGLADNPAELPGYGPLPAILARALTEDAAWRRLVVDPVDGHLIDLGHTTYTPSQALRDFIVNRHGTCVGPYCTRPAVHADLDHIEPFPRELIKNRRGRGSPPEPGGEQGPVEGGRTASANMGPVCRGDHIGKTHDSWHLSMDDDTTMHWTSPLGRRYTFPPRRMLPD